MKVIKDLAAEHMTMVIVTHEMNFARNVADKIILWIKVSLRWKALRKRSLHQNMEECRNFGEIIGGIIKGMRQGTFGGSGVPCFEVLIVIILVKC